MEFLDKIYLSVDEISLDLPCHQLKFGNEMKNKYEKKITRKKWLQYRYIVQ